MKNQSSKPNNHFVYPQTVNKGTKHEWNETGLTLRDYFAAKAMQGYCSMENKGSFRSMEDAVDALVKQSYTIADAMLKEREL